MAKERILYSRDCYLLCCKNLMGFREISDVVGGGRGTWESFRASLAQKLAGVTGRFRENLSSLLLITY